MCLSLSVYVYAHTSNEYIPTVELPGQRAWYLQLEFVVKLFSKGIVLIYIHWQWLSNPFTQHPPNTWFFNCGFISIPLITDEVKPLFMFIDHSNILFLKCFFLSLAYFSNALSSILIFNCYVYWVNPCGRIVVASLFSYAVAHFFTLLVRMAQD